MTSPHLLRPFSSRQLSLVAGDGRVQAFAVLSGRHAGRSVEVHAPTLARRVSELAPEIDTVVFFDDPMPDGATVALIDDMVAAYEDADTDVLAQSVAVTEAVKHVRDGIVVAGIDRTSLAAIRSPEVVDRRWLDRAVESIGERMWVNPTALAAAAGARVALYGSSRSRVKPTV